MFVSRATWTRHEDVREEGIARRISRPPHPSYRQPGKAAGQKRPRDGGINLVPSLLTSRVENEGPLEKRVHTSGRGSGAGPAGGPSLGTRVSKST